MDLIVQDNIVEAIRLLIGSLEKSSDTSLYDEALIVSSRYLRVKKQERLGLLPQDFSLLELSRIRASLLDITSKAFEDNSSVD